ncbi:GNAT family N-acetyltransferase [Candidatus Woesebacteria bacterium]|nr:GNAT family N-acetyltransferase [Candidatus Woesebacteria bacterium]
MFQKSFTTKSGKQIALRYPTIADADMMMEYINAISKENTFITFSGEQLTREEEEAHLQNTMHSISLSDAVVIVAEYNGAIVGVSDVTRILTGRTRERHTARFGISIRKDFRGEGLGKALMSTIIEEATQHIGGLKIIKLQCYGLNTPALNLYKKLGFVEYGRLPEGIQYKGQYADTVLMYKRIR